MYQGEWAAGRTPAQGAKYRKEAARLAEICDVVALAPLALDETAAQ
jgi:hypothetical protein